jgi:hypothetical protein
MRSLSVEAKLALIVLVLTVLSGVAGSRLVGHIFEHRVEDASNSTLAIAANAFAAQEAAEIEKLSSTLDALLANDRLAAAFASRDRKTLLEATTPLFDTMKKRDRITHWYFIEPQPSRAVFLRVHRPELHGDVVDRPTLMRAIETGDVGAGKELGQTAFALRVVRPWYRGGKLIGYMELAEEIDHFLTAMKARTGDEYGILIKKEFLDEKAWARILGSRANTWNDRPDVVVVDTTIFNKGITDFQGNLGDVSEQGESVEELIDGERAWIRGVFPLRDAGGRKVGLLFVLHDFTPYHSAVRAGIIQSFFVMIAFSLVTAALLAICFRLLVFGRLERVRRQAERAADDAGIPPERVVQLGGDAFRRLEALFERIIRGRPPTGGAPPRAG